MKTGSKNIFLSYILSEKTPNYGGAKSISINFEKQIKKGDSSNTSLWSFPNHLGTHVDAPRHFFDKGETIEKFNPDYWKCEKISVLQIPLSKPRWITPKDINMEIPNDIECLLLVSGFHKFRNEKIYFEDNPGVSPEFAEYLRTEYLSLRFLGMDFISVSRFSDRGPGRITHKILLNPDPPGNPILPIEDMDLSSLEPDVKLDKISIFPLRVDQADGSPVTVIGELG